ncbi:MAG TPA: STAS domain-containing protein [Anaerolineaceae bacterium]|nr:STAS domain-containing protein [Anaerolineaceae bacterium]
MCDQANLITLRRADPESVILDLCGFIGSRFERAFESAASDLRSIPVLRVVLNFSSVQGIDGSGLKQLLIFCTLMRKANRKLAAFGVNEQVRQIFELTRMENLLHSCENEYQAVSRLG